jgi:hypothetical protein
LFRIKECPGETFLLQKKITPIQFRVFGVFTNNRTLCLMPALLYE